MTKELLKETEQRMRRSVEATDKELRTIRSARADASLVEHVRVDYYGQKLPIPHLATVSVPDPKTILITVWDKSVLKDVERAIVEADLGLTPQNDGSLIRIAVPPLSEERRAELGKVVAKRAEEGKIALRNLRRDAIESIRSTQKAGDVSEDEARRGQEDVQELTEKYTARIDEIADAKKQDILRV